jgi:hypothetical protein
MATRRTRRSKSLAVQTMELGVAVPQVIAHRVARMALVGASPSARDRKELRRMGTEKVAAATEAWTAMALEAFRQSLWLPWAFLKRRQSASRQLSNAALGIFGKGMAPVRRRAVANAKRLGRIKRR